MQISSKGQYGLRAMLELAAATGNDPVRMSTIAANQSISRKYLHAVLTNLKGAGLVRAVRGQSGGYVLNREPGHITVLEVFCVLEGPLGPADCQPGTRDGELAEERVMQEVWCGLTDVIREHLQSITLSDLVDRRAELRGAASMYHI